jgi:hypothetical protein
MIIKSRAFFKQYHIIGTTSLIPSPFYLRIIIFIIIIIIIVIIILINVDIGIIKNSLSINFFNVLPF